MSQYHAPLPEMLFVDEQARRAVGRSRSCPVSRMPSPDTVAAILEERRGSSRPTCSIRSTRSAIAKARACANDGTVATPPGFKDAYRQFCELGWNGLAKDPEYGGQGMPQLVAAAIDEMWNAANMAFELCPMLTGGAIEAIEMNGSDALKKTYLPKMVSGEWTGTMNLTEPQAGSDLAARAHDARCRSRTAATSSTGNKIFITYGEHDLHRQHRAPRAGAHAGCAAGRQGHLAVRRAEVHRSTPTARPAPATTCAACRSSTSSASTRAPTCRARIRRHRRRGRLSGRRREPRPRVHVRDDEPRPASASACRAWSLSERAYQRARRLRSRARAGTHLGDTCAGHHRPPRRARACC